MLGPKRHGPTPTLPTRASAGTPPVGDHSTATHSIRWRTCVEALRCSSASSRVPLWEAGTPEACSPPPAASPALQSVPASQRTPRTWHPQAQFSTGWAIPQVQAHPTLSLASTQEVSQPAPPTIAPPAICASTRAGYGELGCKAYDENLALLDCDKTEPAQHCAKEWCYVDPVLSRTTAPDTGDDTSC